MNGRRSTRWTDIAAALCVALAATQAAAETLAAGRDRIIGFTQIDSDNNGYVSRVEARSISPVETNFERADANKDGLLDRDEYISLRSVRKPN